MVKILDQFMRKFTPDPFVIAIGLTWVVCLVGVGWTGIPLKKMVTLWGEGVWSLAEFTMQMAMILLGGYVLAVSRPVQKGLTTCLGRVKGDVPAILACSLISFFACWINWGFGLIVASFTCRTLQIQDSTRPYRVLVASAYSGFLVWHGGLSGSIPLLVATPGNFTEELIGGLIPLSQTLFGWNNLGILAGLIIIMPLCNVWVEKQQKGEEECKLPPLELHREHSEPESPAEYLEQSSWVSNSLVLIVAFFLGISWYEGWGRIDLNTINLIVIFLALALHGSTKRFMEAVGDGVRKIGPILMQYPLYAAIMYMMLHSGLSAKLSDLFVENSSDFFLPFWVFISAGVINFFIPSGGGQWAVQAPLVLPAGMELGVDPIKMILAVAWGDAWTNLIQPFFALPLLAIAGMKIRDIMGHCLLLLIASGIYISLCLLWL